MYDTLTVRNQRLALVGTYSSVRDDYIADALLTHLTGTSVTLRDAVHRGSFTIVDEASFQHQMPLTDYSGCACSSFA